MANEYFARTLKRAVDIKLITQDEIKYGNDEKIMQKLKSSTDQKIKSFLAIFPKIKNVLKIAPYGQGEINAKPKFRGVDPLVQTPQGLKRLTSISISFKRKFHKIKEWCGQGYGLSILAKV